MRRQQVSTDLIAIQFISKTTQRRNNKKPSNPNAEARYKLGI